MRIIFTIITIHLTLYTTIAASAVSHSLQKRTWTRDFPWKYVCPDAPPPSGRYPLGMSAHGFNDLLHWCRSTNGGPACSCNQVTGLPECGCDGPNRGMRFDFESMTAAYPCLNCFCIDMRRPGPHQEIVGNTFPLGAAEHLGILPKEEDVPSTNQQVPQGQEHRVAGHGLRIIPAHEAHSAEDVQTSRSHVHGGTRSMIVTTGTKESNQLSVLGHSTVTTGHDNKNSMLAAGGGVVNIGSMRTNPHRLRGHSPRLNALQSSPGAGLSSPGPSIRPDGNTQSVIDPSVGTHSHELEPMGLMRGTHTIEQFQGGLIHTVKRPVRQRKSASSPAAGPGNRFLEWGARSRRTTQTYPRVGQLRAQPAQSLNTLSGANTHERISDDELGIIHRVRMLGRPGQQAASRAWAPMNIDSGGIRKATGSTRSWSEPIGSGDMDWESPDKKGSVVAENF